MKRNFALVVLILSLASTVHLYAQNDKTSCGVTCEPDVTSASYPAVRLARGQLINQRGRLSSIAPRMTGATDTTENIGSQSYNYAIPLVHLPGRAGLDLRLTLYYDSGVWTVDKTNGTATFNADRDAPSYGFKLGFGYLEQGGTYFVLTESDGTKRILNYSSASKYVSSDSSQIEYDSSQYKLRYQDGTQVLYQVLKAGSSLLRPIRVTDRNGNYIAITYAADTLLQTFVLTDGEQTTKIDTITDTLGRQVKFIYDDHARLSRIEQVRSSGAKTLATFGWGTTNLKYSFSGLTVNGSSPANGSSISVLRSVQFSNGAGHVFDYGDWGLVNSIKQTAAASDPLSAPVRSTLSYDYPAATTAISDRPTFQNQTFTYVTKGADGTGTTKTEQWVNSVTKTNGIVSSYSIVDPAGTKTTTNLLTSGTFAGFTNSVEVRDSQNSLLRTKTYYWTSSASPIELRSVGTILNDSGQTSLVYYYYDTYGRVTKATEYGYDGQPKRTTNTTYSNSPTHIQRHILNLPTQVTVVNPSSNAIVSRTDYVYDGVTPTSQSGATAHDATVGNAGNLTQIKRYANAAAASGIITRNFAYDTLGNLRTADLDCCNVQTWTYSPDYQFAYPTTISQGGLLTTGKSYDLDTGAVASSTDENGQETKYEYRDTLDRLTKVTLPNLVTVSSNYEDTTPATEVTQSNSANSSVQWAQFDGAGRRTRSELRNGTVTLSATQVEYNAGRLYRQSNPFAPGSSPLWTTYAYDPLGRTQTITLPDQSTYSYSYKGNMTTIMDPAGKQRRTYIDALGRLSKVEEPGWGDALPAKGSVVISGTERSLQLYCDAPETCLTVYDTGTVTITVNGHATSTTYGASGGRFGTTLLSTPQSIATGLANAINQDSGASVNASASGGIVNLTARVPGIATNSYSVSTSSSTTIPPGEFYFGPDPSFYATPSAPTLEGGQDATAGQNVASLNTPMTTTYVYDVLDNLISATQGYLASVQGVVKPGQTRSYIYDSLGRVKTAQTPESGTINYTYKDFGAVDTRTDARGVVTSFSYDSLNRPYQISYNVGTSGVPATPTVTYTYGESMEEFNKGRLLTMTDGVGSETYKYNKMGQVIGLTKVIEGATYQLSYEPNLDGTIGSITYPAAGGGAGRIVAYAYDSGRLQQISSGGVNYMTVGAGDYNAAGQLTHFTYGNGVEGNITYNNRLQVEAIRYNNNQEDLLNLVYSYTTVPGGTDDNGQIRSIKSYTSPGVEDTTKSQNFEYDAWARLKKAYTTNMDAGVQGTWRLEWDYDRFGNRLNQTITAGSVPVFQPQLSVSETTNCITTGGFACDRSGNLKQDPAHTYTYDATNQLVAIDGGSTSYAYDGNGLRVTKTIGTDKTTYIFSGAHVVAEFTGTQTKTLSREYVYAGGQLLATIAAGAVTYAHRGHLSTRVETDPSGTPTRQYGHYPFGETWYEFGTASRLKFTSYERATENELDESQPDYAIFRHYSVRYGRFMQPDPMWGAYTYTGNDPINLVDPLGLWCQSIGWSGKEGEPNITVICGPDSGRAGGGLNPGRSPMKGGDTDGLGSQILDRLLNNPLMNGLSKVSDYLPGACSGGVFAFGGASVGHEEKPGAGQFALTGAEYSPDKGWHADGGSSLTEAFAGNDHGVGYVHPDGEILVFVPVRSVKVKGGHVDAGVFYGVKISKVPVSIGGFVEAEGSKRGPLGAAAGGGGYLNFTNASTCLELKLGASK